MVVKKLPHWKRTAASGRTRQSCQVAVICRSWCHTARLWVAMWSKLQSSSIIIQLARMSSNSMHHSGDRPLSCGAQQRPVEYVIGALCWQVDDISMVTGDYRRCSCAHHTAFGIPCRHVLAVLPKTWISNSGQYNILWHSVLVNAWYCAVGSWKTRRHLRPLPLRVQSPLCPWPHRTLHNDNVSRLLWLVCNL